MLKLRDRNLFVTARKTMPLIKCKECYAEISEQAESCPRCCLGKALSEVWHDLQADRKWKYEQLTPIQLPEKSELRIHPPAVANSSEPLGFGAAGHGCFRSPALSFGSLWHSGCRFWLFRIPSIGVPLAGIDKSIDLRLCRDPNRLTK